MENKEERILITKCSSSCYALHIAFDPVGDEENMYCDKSGTWEIITEKDCAKCKNPVLVGMTRSEAIEKIAKVFCRADANFPECDYCTRFKTKRCTTFLKEWFLGSAESALNALLEDKK